VGAPLFTKYLIPIEKLKIFAKKYFLLFFPKRQFKNIFSNLNIREGPLKIGAPRLQPTLPMR